MFYYNDFMFLVFTSVFSYDSIHSYIFCRSITIIRGSYMFSSNNQIDVSEMNENYYVVSNKKSIFIAIGIVFIIPAIALALIGLFNSNILYTMLICSGGLVLVYLWFYVMLNNERFTCSYGHYEFRSPWGRKKEFEASDIGYAKLYLPNSIILYNREGKKLCTIPLLNFSIIFFVVEKCYVFWKNGVRYGQMNLLKRFVPNTKNEIKVYHNCITA